MLSISLLPLALVFVATKGGSTPVFTPPEGTHDLFSNSHCYGETNWRDYPLYSPEHQLYSQHFEQLSDEQAWFNHHMSQPNHCQHGATEPSYQPNQQQQQQTQTFYVQHRGEEEEDSGDQDDHNDSGQHHHLDEDFPSTEEILRWHDTQIQMDKQEHQLALQQWGTMGMQQPNSILTRQHSSHDQLARQQDATLRSASGDRDVRRENGRARVPARGKRKVHETELWMLPFEGRIMEACEKYMTLALVGYKKAKNHLFYVKSSALIGDLLDGDEETQARAVATILQLNREDASKATQRSISRAKMLLGKSYNGIAKDLANRIHVQYQQACAKLRKFVTPELAALLLSEKPGEYQKGMYELLCHHWKQEVDEGEAAAAVVQ